MAYSRLVVAVGLIAIAAPAAAALQNSQAGSSSSAADATKYCIQYEPDTGSRLNRVECKTKAEWAKQGVQVDQLKK